MGTPIELKVGPIAVDSGKDSYFNGHNCLFRSDDQCAIPRERDAGLNSALSCDAEPLTDEAFVCSLSQVVPRLELLGYTPETVESAYFRRVEQLPRWEGVEGEEEGYPDFSAFLDFLIRNPIHTLEEAYVDSCFEYGYVPGRFKNDPFLVKLEFQTYGSSEAGYVRDLLSFLFASPYSALRALALVPDNVDARIVWRYGPLVEAGWAQASDFEPGVGRSAQVLIVTEGTSDTHILQRAFSLIMPDLADFLRFLDVGERHPFSGASGLAAFAEGLAAIESSTKILFVFDNDAEGWEAFERVSRLGLSQNMRAVTLPSLPELINFSTNGPQGLAVCDINRRAAAIECYLDLKLPGRPEATVTWTNFKKASGTYQGSLDYKESYTKYFLSLTPDSILAGSYDVEKLRKVLSHIVSECVKVSSYSHSPWYCPES